MLTGKVPTTPTTAAVIAGIQVQEAIKLIHARADLPSLAGQGYFFNGLTHDSYIVQYEMKDYCPSHESFAKIVETDLGVANASAGEMLELARSRLGRKAVLELHRELVVALRCEHCHEEESICQLLGRLTEKQARCPGCGEVRNLIMTHAIEGNEIFLDQPMKALGIPPLDIVSGRSGMDMVHFEFSRDAALFDL